MRDLAAACLIAAAASTATAQDVVFVATLFDNTALGGSATDPFKDISSFSSATTAFRVGSNPTAIAFDGANLYVGGNVNGPTTVPDPDNPGQNIDLTVEIAEISDFFGVGAAKDVIGSEIDAVEFGPFSGRGYTGFDWNDDFGLLATRDFGSNGDPLPQILLFDRTDPLDFSAELQVSTTGLRGISGPAFDLGFDGMGFQLSTAQMGPAAALPLVGFGQAAGLDPNTFDPGDDLYGENFGSPTNPNSEPLYTFGCNDVDPQIGTIWRDFDIHPTTGMIAARVNNVLALADRTSLNGSENLRCFIPPQGQGISVAQNVEICHNTACGPEFVVINQRANSGAFALFQQTVLLYDFAGNPLSYTIENPDGTLAPLDIGGPANIFSFFWDEPSQTLFVCDGNNRTVYALTLKCAPAFEGVCCFACDPGPTPGNCPDASGAPSASVCQDVADQAACEALGGTYRDGLACADATDPCQCVGDINGDGLNDVFDFADLASNFGTGTPDCATRAEGDLNCDGVVDVFDFADLASNFGCDSN